MSGSRVGFLSSGRIWAHLNTGGTRQLSMETLTIAVMIGSNSLTYSFRSHVGIRSRLQDLLGDFMMRVFTSSSEA